MYQLSHLLIEQRNILATLRDENVSGDGKGVIAETEEDGNFAFVDSDRDTSSF